MAVDLFYKFMGPAFVVAVLIAATVLSSVYSIWFSLIENVVGGWILFALSVVFFAILVWYNTIASLTWIFLLGLLIVIALVLVIFAMFQGAKCGKGCCTTGQGCGSGCESECSACSSCSSCTCFSSCCSSCSKKKKKKTKKCPPKQQPVWGREPTPVHHGGNQTTFY